MGHSQRVVRPRPLQNQHFLSYKAHQNHCGKVPASKASVHSLVVLLLLFKKHRQTCPCWSISLFWRHSIENKSKPLSKKLGGQSACASAPLQKRMPSIFPCLPHQKALAYCSCWNKQALKQGRHRVSIRKVLLSNWRRDLTLALNFSLILNDHWRLWLHSRIKTF